jgi:hypothetical protein
MVTLPKVSNYNFVLQFCSEITNSPRRPSPKNFGNVLIRIFWKVYEKLKVARVSLITWWAPFCPALTRQTLLEVNQQSSISRTAAPGATFGANSGWIRFAFAKSIPLGKNSCTAVTWPPPTPVQRVAGTLERPNGGPVRASVRPLQTDKWSETSPLLSIFRKLFKKFWSRRYRNF